MRYFSDDGKLYTIFNFVLYTSSWNFLTAQLSSSCQGMQDGPSITGQVILLYQSWAGRRSGAAPETHTKRQATQHDCLPSLQGEGDKGFEKEIVYGEEKTILFWAK